MRAAILHRQRRDPSVAHIEGRVAAADALSMEQSEATIRQDVRVCDVGAIMDHAGTVRFERPHDHAGERGADDRRFRQSLGIFDCARLGKEALQVDVPAM